VRIRKQGLSFEMSCGREAGSKGKTKKRERVEPRGTEEKEK